MGLKDDVNRLRAALRNELESFELTDGSRHWYDPFAVGAELYLHGTACLRADYFAANRPEPPEIVRALARARNRRAAFAAAVPNLAMWPYQREAFVERGELVHRSMIAGRAVDESAPSDLSEPGP